MFFLRLALVAALAGYMLPTVSYAMHGDLAASYASQAVQADSVEEALVILISAYDLLGMDDLKSDTNRVLQANYPNSKMLHKGVPDDQRVWWKFWESLY